MIRLGITMGDPAGVGPEVILRALAGLRADGVKALVFGDRRFLEDLAGRLGLSTGFEIRQVGRLDAEAAKPGRFTTRGGLVQGAYLRAGADSLEKGEVDALVTGPINKRALGVCGMTGPGHTEWLTERFAARRSVMMLSGPRLKVILATRHLPISEVAASLNADDLVGTVQLASNELQKYFFPEGPRLAIAALNPHGEVDGEPGREEREIIQPAIAELRDRGLDVSGPISGDAVFSLALGGKFDAVVSMYHDQGLAPLKALHFTEAVNVTLGLGVVRTSPDHGVGYDIAGRNKADATSMLQACRLAVDMAQKDRSA